MEKCSFCENSEKKNWGGGSGQGGVGLGGGGVGLGGGAAG